MSIEQLHMSIEQLLAETFKTPEEAIKKYGTGRIVCCQFPPLSLVEARDDFGELTQPIPPAISDYFDFYFTLRQCFTKTGEIYWRYVQD